MSRPKGSKNKISKKIKRICRGCEKEFYRWVSDVKRGKGIFCSKECWWKFRKGKPTGKPAWNKGMKFPEWSKENHPQWKGGKIISYEGYVRIRNSKLRSKYESEHRLIIESKIGRKLNPKESVHHLDHNKINNNPSNLYLFPNESKHQKYHKTLIGIVKEMINYKRKGKWAGREKEYRREYSKEYKSKPVVRLKERIRQQTRRKYGKLPKGFEYHHIEPYKIDVWLGVYSNEHQKIKVRI